MPPNASKTIFIANIPYDVSEEQLSNVFSEVGPVSNVEIKFDNATGRSKGYAFVQYGDEATAFSAVRNLHEVLVNGRNLRVELSTEEPGPRRRGGGGGGGGGGPRRSHGDREPSPPRGGGRREYDGFGGPPGLGHGPGPMPVPGPGGPGGPPGPSGPPIDLNLVPPGRDVPPGQSATDAISKTLAAINPGQMQDVMSGMKTLLATQPEEAKQLLMSRPQLAYALFQAMLLMNIVDPAVLHRITPLPPASAAPPPTQYPPQSGYGFPPSVPPAQPPYPPSHQPGYPPPQQGYGAPPPGPPAGYGAPPNAAPTLSPAVQAQLATLPEDQRAMLMQVLTLTPEQINAVDATQRESIRQLRQQFLGAAA